MNLVSSFAGGVNRLTEAPLNLVKPHLSSSNRVVSSLDAIKRTFTPKASGMSTKAIDAADYKNLGVNALDSSNFLHDLDSSVEGLVARKKYTFDKTVPIKYTNTTNLNYNNE